MAILLLRVLAEVVAESFVCEDLLNVQILLKADLRTVNIFPRT